ncbi:MAG: DNA-binding domain-containing protein [Pseudomonadota bacterium]|nr:DNA-binding domain-containing protein [Pseudomonadota bacterium]
MITLKEIQDRFQRGVIDGDDAVLTEFTDSSKEKRGVLFGVYRNAYTARLVDVLSSDHEKLHAFLGDEQFETMARDYIAANPSYNRSARWFAARLPEFLQGTSPYKEQPVLADMARLERALNDVFDGAEAVPLTLDDLSAVAPQDWSNLVFMPHPAVRRIALRSNAAEICKALHDEEEPPAPLLLPEPAPFLVYRDDATSSFRPLPADEAMMWDEASNGVSFGVLCEMMSMYAGEEHAAMRAAGYLRGWVAAGLLAKGSAGV